MIRLELKGMEDAIGYIEALTKNQLPYATMLALNDLAFEIRTEEIETMRRVFDRPKPATLKNVVVKKATKTNLYARVLFDQLYDKGLDEYMAANIWGGGRVVMKPSERRLGRFWVPGLGAKLDQYGNMKGGQITQILSRLGRFGDVSGYNMNETPASRKRRYGASKATEYFIVTQQRGSLKPGVYQRTEKRGNYTSSAAPRAARGGKSGAYQSGSGGMIKARGVMPVMVFTKAQPKYKPRWPFMEEGKRIIDTRFKAIFEKRIADALRNAR